MGVFGSSLLYYVWVEQWNPQFALWEGTPLRPTGDETMVMLLKWKQRLCANADLQLQTYWTIILGCTGDPVLVFAGLRVVHTSHTAAGSREGHSQLGFPFQPIRLYQGRNTVCLFRWDISLPLQLQVTVNVTQVLFPVRKGEKICLWIVSDVLPIVREDSIWWRITVLLKSCTSDRDLGQLLLPEMGDLSLISIKPELWLVGSCPSAFLEKKWIVWRGGGSSGSG